MVISVWWITHWLNASMCDVIVAWSLVFRSFRCCLVFCSFRQWFVWRTYKVSHQHIQHLRVFERPRGQKGAVRTKQTSGWKGKGLYHIVRNALVTSSFLLLVAMPLLLAAIIWLYHIVSSFFKIPFVCTGLHICSQTAFGVIRHTWDMLAEFAI